MLKQSKKLFSGLSQYNKHLNGVLYTTTSTSKKGHCLITCKQKSLNHYMGTSYTSLDSIRLASKGWAHSKSKNDYFEVNPVPVTPFAEVPFEHLGISRPIIEALHSMEIKSSTEFQAHAIEKLERSDHVLLAAETGCGKTISYLLPIIKNILRSKRTTDELNSPRVLILVPNRELAYQIGEVAQTLCNSVDLKVKIITGGRTKQLMINPCFEEVDILVGTPGSLGKLTNLGIYRLHEVLHTVLDEADTLLDDSFVDRVSGLIKRVFQSQIVLVSATIPRKIPDFLAPIEDSLTQILSENVHRPLIHVRQKFLRILKSGKPSMLLNLANSNTAPMICFTNRNETCKWLSMFLRENGIGCANISGDMHYALRIEQWNDFVKGNVQILSATDVASRGLNTIQVNHILNYDFPFYSADYLHRIGRVGRMGSSKDCKITNFVSGSREVMLVQQIETALRKNEPINNVDGNITNLLQNRLVRDMRQNSG